MVGNNYQNNHLLTGLDDVMKYNGSEYYDRGITKVVPPEVLERWEKENEKRNTSRKMVR